MTPKITEVEEFKFIVYPAMVYIERTDGEPNVVDKGGEHLGDQKPGVSVPFPTRRHGELYKEFGIGEYDDGTLFAYGKGAMISTTKSKVKYLAAARIGGLVSYKGIVYTIRETPNQNIELEPVE